MCDASTRQVKFWCIFEFFAPHSYSYVDTKFESRRARKTHRKKKTHMSSRVIDYSKWDRLKYSSSSEEEEDDDEGGKEMEIARSGAVLEKLSLSLFFVVTSLERVGVAS